MAFAVKDHGQTREQRNAATRALMERVNNRQRVHLSGTVLDGVFAIRIAIVAFRTDQARVSILLEDLKAELASL